MNKIDRIIQRTQLVCRRNENTDVTNIYNTSIMTKFNIQFINSVSSTAD